MKTLLSFLAIITLILINFTAPIGAGSINPNNENANNNNNFDEEEELSLLADSSKAAALKYEPKTSSTSRAGHATSIDFDPFAFTFDDYLREADKWQPTGSLQHRAGPGQSSSIVIEDEEENHNDNTIPVSRQQQQQQQQQPNKETNRLNNISNDNNKYHYDDAASASSTTTPSPSLSSNEISSSSSSSNNANAIDTLATKSAPSSNQQALAEQASEQEDDEIKLQFAWKTLPTSRCSRPCGRGHRLNHLSCLDLKFSVRVEDELCLKAAPKLVRPSEVSSEACNEFDCEPKWQLIDEMCTASSSSSSSSCRGKRIECTKVDRRGELVYLDESMCNSTERVGGDQTSTTTTTAAPHHIRKDHDDDDFTIDLELTREAGGNHRFNQISDDSAAAADTSQQLYAYAGAPSADSSNRFHSNEPFWEPGDWSECRDGPCGGLGRRHRNLTCKLFLTKSEKLVELPASSCQQSPSNTAGMQQLTTREEHTGDYSFGPHQLHREEPCYMDCVASGSGGSNDNNDISITAVDTRSRPSQEELNQNQSKDQDQDDEEDLMLTRRYSWRYLHWSECSAKCLGGRRESHAECFDQVSGRRARSARLCDERSRPVKPLVESCNQVPCAPEWRLEPFSNCSRRCGSAGIRSRSVACVELVPLETGESDYMLVSNDLCLQHSEQLAMPHKLEPCNRFDCPPEWQVSEWTDCQTDGRDEQSCSESTTWPAEGHRNRTVICVQEFANRDGAAATTTTIWTPGDGSHRDLHRAGHQRDWHPGKAVQVPPQRCQELHGFVPVVSEKCLVYNEANGHKKDCQRRSASSMMVAPQSVSIDSEPEQNFRLASPADSLAHRKRTITLKVGGRAELVEGRTLKLKCRLVAAKKSPSTGASIQQAVEWRKDGQLIFTQNSTWADRQPVAPQQLSPAPDDNSILANDVLLNHQELLADEPAKQSPSDTTTSSKSLKTTTTFKTTTKTGRNLSVRSNTNQLDNHHQQQQQQSFQFVPQLGGRFSLVKENTLKIKRLKQHDSGTYTCWSATYSVSQSIELSVISKRQFLQANNEHQLQAGTAANNYFAS